MTKIFTIGFSSKSPEYQNLKSRGPIPECTYVARQNEWGMYNRGRY
jgi:hypothetical protein